MRQKLLFTLGISLAIILPLLLVFFLYPKKISKVYGNDYVITDNLVWAVDSQSLDGTHYTFEGWVILPGIEQGYPVLDNKGIWLYDTSGYIFYKLDSQQSSKRNTAISSMIEDGVDYQSSCFQIDIDLHPLQIQDKCFDIYICYQWHNMNYLVNTNISLDHGKLIWR